MEKKPSKEEIIADTSVAAGMALILLLVPMKRIKECETANRIVQGQTAGVDPNGLIFAQEVAFGMGRYITPPVQLSPGCKEVLDGINRVVKDARELYLGLADFPLSPQE